MTYRNPNPATKPDTRPTGTDWAAYLAAQAYTKPGRLQRANRANRARHHTQNRTTH